jgi:hypothetical protein
MLLKMEYLYPLLPNLETYYLLHGLQICMYYNKFILQWAYDYIQP